MKTVKIDSKSWHFWVIRQYDSHKAYEFRHPEEYPDEANTCTYWRTFIIALLIQGAIGLMLIFCAIAGVGVLVGMPIIAILHLLGIHLSFIKPEALNTCGTILMLEIMALMGGVTWWVWFRIKKYREEHNPASFYEDDKPAGIFTIAKLAIKDKLCSKIEIV